MKDVVRHNYCKPWLVTRANLILKQADTTSYTMALDSCTSDESMLCKGFTTFLYVQLDSIITKLIVIVQQAKRMCLVDEYKVCESLICSRNVFLQEFAITVLYSKSTFF